MLHGPQDGKHRKPLNSKRQQRPSPAYNSPSTADYLAHLNAVAAKKVRRQITRGCGPACTCDARLRLRVMMMP
eukprot:11426-Eustigmatos_ZCMA.PRE.1